MRKAGALHVATTFEEHMAPGVLWLEDPRFAEAWNDLILEEGPPPVSNKIEAAYTSLGASLPAYINARAEDGEVVVRVRSENAAGPSEIRLSEDAWLDWLAQALRIRV